MSQITRLLDAAASGDRKAAADLLPLVYDELRQLAAARMAAESPDQTLQPTALVHEAYLRLVRPADVARWDNRGHFFAAAAEAILDAALTRLADEDPVAARVVELRHFAGLSIEDAAAALGMSRATAYRHWTYARAWLRDAVSGAESD
jgi:DNA-directed RNA polymerase specialized sigma24 family protein